MIGIKIRELRKSRNISQVDFARRIGISQAYISMIENNTRFVSSEIIKAIARELEIDICEFQTYKESKDLIEIVRLLDGLSQTQLSLIKHIAIELHKISKVSITNRHKEAIEAPAEMLPTQQLFLETDLSQMAQSASA